MKKHPLLGLTLVSFALSLTACTSKLAPETDTPLINSQYMQKIVATLSADEFKGRKAGSAEIQQAAAFIEKELQSYSASKDIKVYRDSFQVRDFMASNVFSYIPGNDPKLKDELIIIGAHYDHIGEIQNDSNDKIANGANDNASGVAASLAIAKHFSQTRNNKRSILIALFSAEEFGLLGSTYFSENFSEQKESVYCMINFEMIGVPMQDKDFQAYLTGYKTSTMASIINAHSEMNLLGFLPQAQEYNLFQRSDNYPVYNALSVPAQTISSFDFSNYEYYHDVNDEAEELDFLHMADLVNNLIPAIEKISQNEEREITLIEN